MDIKQGNFVKIIRCDTNNKFYDQHLGQIGIVKNILGGFFNIKFDNCKEIKSFYADEIRLIKKSKLPNWF